MIDAGVSPVQVAVDYDLDIADVYRALTYYYDHPDEIQEGESSDRLSQRICVCSEVLTILIAAMEWRKRREAHPDEHIPQAFVAALRGEDSDFGQFERLHS